MIQLLVLFSLSLLVFDSKGLPSSKVFRSLDKQQHFHSHYELYGAEQEDVKARVQKYVQMREIQKMKKQGTSDDDIAAAVKNGTFIGLGKAITNKKGYQKFLGKGSLDQRLRSVVNYKRSSVSDSTTGGGELTPSEQQELDAMMDSEEGDDDDEELADDEEELYESLVLKIIEENKLNDLKRNFILDKDAQKREAEEKLEEKLASVNVSAESANATSVMSSNTAANATVVDDDMYTPKSSAWGVFQRPKDISKKFGGGRVITRAEMNRMDEEYQEKQKSGQQAQKIYISEVARIEDENTVKIRDAISRSRLGLGLGF
jgi:hypothetical protein